MASRMPVRHHRPEDHRSGRAPWLRAAVLGANDGIVSVGALVVGVLGGGAGFAETRTAGIAGLVAGALSMAAGEYVSVSAQRDAEHADLTMEAEELVRNPGAELAELTGIYRNRGLTPELAAEVARQLTANDALEAHARDELGLTPSLRARPLQAAWTSAAAFCGGAGVPVLGLLLAPRGGRTVIVLAVSVVALACFGAVGAKVGGAPPLRAALRVVAGGLLAMLVTLGIGELTGAALG